MEQATSVYRQATIHDLDAIMVLERQGFLPSEAASEDSMRLRLTQAGFLFRLWERSGEIQGYVCGTLSAAPQLTDDSMTKHDADGALVCVHSVVIAESQRRRGHALSLLLDYVAAVSELGYTRFQLICKKEKQVLYQRAGFVLLGPSDVVHGPDPWFLMQREISAYST